jgi:hypothetical protein
VLALELSALFHQFRELVVGKDFWKILCHITLRISGCQDID